MLESLDEIGKGGMGEMLFGSFGRDIADMHSPRALLFAQFLIFALGQERATSDKAAGAVKGMGLGESSLS